MINYFPDEIIIDAQQHALAEYPNESCGAIVDGNYYPCNNIAKDKINHFEISPQEYLKLENIGNINAIIHSHDNYPHASKQDMITQQGMHIPFGLIFLKNKSIIGTYFWGDELPPQELLGRPFVHGIYDCYALARDWYRLHGCRMSDYPREVDWWLTNEDVILDNIKNERFDFVGQDIKDIKIGDGLLMTIRTNKINHTAVYIGNGLILHHLYGRLSCREPLVRYNKYIRYIVRHRDYR